MTDDQLEHDIDDFIKHKQQNQDTDHQLTIHQVTHSASASKTSTSSICFAPTHAQPHPN